MDIERCYDLTLPITEAMPIYPGDPTPRLGDRADVHPSRISRLVPMA